LALGRWPRGSGRFRFLVLAPGRVADARPGAWGVLLGLRCTLFLLPCDYPCSWCPPVRLSVRSAPQTRSVRFASGGARGPRPSGSPVVVSAPACRASGCPGPARGACRHVVLSQAFCLPSCFGRWTFIASNVCFPLAYSFGLPRHAPLAAAIRVVFLVWCRAFVGCEFVTRRAGGLPCVAVGFSSLAVRVERAGVVGVLHQLSLLVAGSACLPCVRRCLLSTAACSTRAPLAVLLYLLFPLQVPRSS